jgi:plasmid stabilization system protein ParE
MEIKELEFSQRSLFEINIIADYIENKWSEKSKIKFLNILNKNFNHIQKNPELFPVSEFEKLRKCVVSKQTSIFFIIEKNKIYIVSVFDTRQNPVKIKE